MYDNQNFWNKCDYFYHDSTGERETFSFSVRPKWNKVFFEISGPSYGSIEMTMDQALEFADLIIKTVAKKKKMMP